MRFCEPLGLVFIAAMTEHAIREGERVIVRCPTDTNVANYLARMRLGSVLAGLGAEHDLPQVREHSIGDALFELSQFDGGRGAGGLAALVHGAVETYNLDAADALYEALCEAGQNVAHHSGQQRGFVAAQRIYHGTRLFFAVSDSGQGMLGSLAKRGAKSDREALELALTPGVSETEDPPRGMGLPEVVLRLEEMNGALWVVSGSASVLARGHSRSFTTYKSGHFTGTALQGYVEV